MSHTEPGGTPMQSIPMLDLAAQLAPLRADLHIALDRILDTTAFVSGPAVDEFEQAFARYCQVAECIGVSTGTSALHIAAQCLDIGPGDEVITVSMSFIATAWPLLYLGATPVFVDIDEQRYTLDPAQLEAAVTSRTRAIIVVHLYGQCADMDPILQVAAARGIHVIEDCAQAHGAEYKGRRAGSMGVFGCFSFYPSKNLPTLGEGGAITTNDASLAARARRIRDHAQADRYRHTEVGYNYRMDGFKGAVLGVGLRHLESWTERRQAAGTLYDRLLEGTSVSRPYVAPEGRHVRHLYVIRDAQRDELREQLAARGISSSLHYPLPIHLQEPFARFARNQRNLPVTERHAATCLSLPLYPDISESQIHRVVNAIRAAGR